MILTIQIDLTSFSLPCLRSEYHFKANNSDLHYFAHQRYNFVNFSYFTIYRVPTTDSANKQLTYPGFPSSFVNIISDLCRS